MTSVIMHPQQQQYMCIQLQRFTLFLFRSSFSIARDQACQANQLWSFC